MPQKIIKYFPFWLPVVGIYLLNIYFYRQADIPWGHDSEHHISYTLAFLTQLKHHPFDAWSFLHSYPIRYGPLTYLVAVIPGLFLENAWLFFITTLLFTAGAMVFIYQCAKTMTQETQLSLLAVLLIVGMPVWYIISISYNLEMPLVASTACACWLLLDRRFQQTIRRAVLSGLVLGLCLLSKAVSVIIIVPMVLAYAWLALREKRKIGLWMTIHRLLTATIGFSVGLFWYASQWRKISDELAVDLANQAQPGIRPWWTYLLLLALGTNLLPFLVVVILWLPKQIKARFPGASLVPAVGAISGFLFFSIIGTKRDWYVTSSIVLSIIAMMPLLKSVQMRHRWIINSLFIFSCCVAVLPWLPSTQRLVQVIAPFAPSLPGIDDFRLNQDEKLIVDSVLSMQKTEGPMTYVVLSPSPPVHSAKIYSALYLSDPRLLFLQGIYIPHTMAANRNWLRDTESIFVVERSTNEKNTLGSVRDNYDSNTKKIVGILEANLADFILLERQKLSANYHLLVFRDRRFMPGWQGEVGYDDLLNVYELRHYYGHLRYLIRAHKLCSQGSRQRALQMFEMFERYEPDNGTAKAFHKLCLQN